MSAKKETAAEEQLTENTTQEQATAGDEMVTVCLFKDNERYKDDVFVAVNGKTWQIRRGEPVQIPRYVADVLDQSMKQDTATANLIERESARYEAEAKARNI